ncbi:uncharacterized protein METZ01_LOCUS513301, partial [marine metagenome]
KLKELKRRLEKVEDDGSEILHNVEIENMLKRFSEKLNDDLNISGALGELFILVNSLFGNLDSKILGYCSARKALKALEIVDTVLGVMDDTEGDVDENIQQLIDARTRARSNKDWKKADVVRDQLDKLGIILDDTPDGTVWKKK